MAVMNTKIGVNQFGATQTKATNATSSNVSAHDANKLGGENIGDVLNKIVDANWVDPSKKVRTAGDPNLDKDAFFKLMLTQMKNQDPTNPLKSHEMAAQLASFSSLEQMQNINSNLEEMKNAQKPTENFQALNLIGKAVAGDSAKVVRGVNDRAHDFKFSLPMDASEVSVKVRDIEGNIVRSYNLKSLKAGENKLTWNGEDDKGSKSFPGEYTFIAEAKTADGKKLGVKTEFDGVITGVSYSPEGPVLHVGNQAVKFRDVKKITDPRLATTDQNVKDVTNLDLKKDDVKVQTGKEGNVEQQNSSMNSGSVAKSNIMNSVGLSREMMEQIAKETAK